MRTKLRGEFVKDGSITAEDVDDSLELELTKLRVTEIDSEPGWLNEKIIHRQFLSSSVDYTTASKATLFIDSIPPMDITGATFGKPTSGEIVWAGVMTRDIIFSSSWAYCFTPATSQVVFNFQIGNTTSGFSSIIATGTLTFNASVYTGSISLPENVIVAGSPIRLVAPASQDQTFSGPIFGIQALST
jgi:hypothetical protein